MFLLRHGSSRCFTQLPHHPLPHARAHVSLRPQLAATLQAQLQSRRSFHIGTSFSNATAGVAEVISSIHHAGVPWYLTIPLVAVGINLTIRLPLHYYNRRRVVKMKELTPLLSAWAARARSSSGPSRTATESRRMFLKSSNRIYKAFGVQRWKAFVSWLAPLAPFVIVSASLRRLTGVYSATPDGGVPLDTAFDPSLAQGGLLWFTDLTAADPYYVLPIMSSVAIATNLWLNMPADRLRTLLTLDSQQGGGASDSRLARALGRLSLAMPLLPLLMSYLPSAIILYWVTNFSLTIVNDVVVRRLVPDKPPRVEQFKGDDDFKNRVMPYLPAAYPPAAEGSGKVAVDSEATKKS